MLDPYSASVLFALFVATEKVISYAGGKVADAMTKPIQDALEDKARWLAGTDETSKRWKAFQQAFANSRAIVSASASNDVVAEQVALTLESALYSSDQDLAELENLADELEKASLVSERPDTRLMTDVCLAAMQKNGLTLARADVADTVANFVSTFQDQLFAQPAYQDLMLKRAWWDKLRKPRYDTRERYLAQIVERHRDLEFVGIPELKDRQAMRIEDIFINLQAEAGGGGIDLPGHLIRPPNIAGFATVDDVIATPEVEVDKPSIVVFSHHGGRDGTKGKVSANEALRENERIVVLGDPGAGKTTLLKYITLAFGQKQSGRLGLDEDRLPIFIRLYDYVAKKSGRQGDYSLIDYLYTQARENLALSLEPGFFESELSDGNCCVCLDGLDELGDAASRLEVTAAVTALTKKHQRSRFIVTSRKVGYEEAPLDGRLFAHHTVLPFGDDDIRLFVHKWYTVREKDPAIARERENHLIKTILAEPRIKTLATNPLLLTIVALVHRIEAELPHERVKLYEKCVAALVETWENIKGLTNADRQRPYYKNRRRLLEQLAYWMHAQPSTTGRTREVKLGDLELQLTRFLLENPKLGLDEDGAAQEARDFIKLVKARTGLLVERGEHVYAFAHPTFQEYLSAVDIEHRHMVHGVDKVWQEIKDRLHDPHWHEVILLLIGSLNRYDEAPTIILRNILQAGEQDQFEPLVHRHLFLAGNALGDRAEVENELQHRVADALIEIIVAGEPAGDDAMSVIEGLPSDPYIEQRLLDLALDNSVLPQVRMEFGEHLDPKKRKGDITSVFLALANNRDIDASVRLASAAMLVELDRIGDARSVFESIAGHLDAPLKERTNAMQAMVVLGDADEALAILGDVIRDKGFESWERENVIHQIGRSWPEDLAIPWLTGIAEDLSLHFGLRCASLGSMWRLGYRKEIASILSTISLEIGMPDDSNTFFHESGEIFTGYGQSYAIFVDWSSDDQMTGFVWNETTQNLAGLSFPGDASYVLLSLAQDGMADVWMRCRAISYFGKLNESNDFAAELIAIILDDKAEAMVRCEAAQNLPAAYATPEVIEVFRELVRNNPEKPFETVSVAQALRHTGHCDEAVLAVSSIVRVQNSEFRYLLSVIGLLEDCGKTVEVLNVLHDIAHNPKIDFSARAKAARALGKLGSVEDAISSLIPAAYNAPLEGEQRLMAAFALGELGRIDDQFSLLMSIVRDSSKVKDFKSTAYLVVKQRLLHGDRK